MRPDLGPFRRLPGSAARTNDARPHAAAPGRNPWRRRGFAFLFLLAWLSAVPCVAAMEEPRQEGAGEAAEEARDEGTASWRLEAALGVVATTGNTETRTVNGRVGVETRRDAWTFDASFELLESSESGDTTARRFVVRGAADYDLTARDYLFGAIRYTDARFSGFDYRISETAGYGRRVLDGEALSLSFEVGAGARQNRIDDGPGIDEVVARGAGKLEWTFGEGASLRQEVTVVSGGEGTVTDSVTALAADLVAGLVMEFSFEAHHSSQVPAGFEKTDTLTSLNLVYELGS